MKKVLLSVLALVLVSLAFVAGSTFSERDVRSEAAPGGGRVASVTERYCSGGRCEVLWIGGSAGRGTKVATLDPGQACDEIAWTRDGTRVAFLIDGHQLRFYRSDSFAPAGRIDLIVPDARPTTRVARGVTFSENGQAITFDDCPRAHSGCRAGLAAVPQ